MHALIATTGALTAAPAVEFTRHLLSKDGRATVTTVIEVPRSFLDQLRAEGWHPLGAYESNPRRRRKRKP